MAAAYRSPSEIAAAPAIRPSSDSHKEHVPVADTLTYLSHHSPSSFDLRSPYVRLEVRPANLQELNLVVDMRMEVFGPGKEASTAGSASIPKHTGLSGPSEVEGRETKGRRGTAPPAPDMSAGWKAESLQNLIARQSKGSVIFVVTARDVRHPDAQPVLVASVEASTHEFHEVGFSPCLAQVEDEEEDGEGGEEGADGWRLQGGWDRGAAGFWAGIPGARGSSVGKASCSSSQPSVLLARTSFLDTPPENKGTGIPSPAHERKQSKLYVTGMMVVDAFRRQGVAAALLTAVEEYARGRGINYICLYVDAYNSSAQRLYQKSGYLVVPFSPQAEAFASKIGLYKGAYAARQYSFAYRRLPPRRALGGAWHVGQATRGPASLDGQDPLRLHWAGGGDGPGMGREVDGKGDGGAEMQGRESRRAPQAAEEGRWCAGPREAWKEQPCAWGNPGRENVVWEDRGKCLVGDGNGRDAAEGTRTLKGSRRM